MRTAVYGASGYQGKLVGRELLRRGIEPVLVGRDGDRLRAAAREIGFGGAEPRVAGTDDPAALIAAFGGTDAVVNCAGPFTVAGEAVVSAAIAAGCHYVDTAGEQLYLKRIFDRFGTDAARAGVSVVPGLNDDGLLSDLIAHLAAASVDPVEELTIALDLVPGSSTPSRGTLRSMLATMEAFRSGGVGYQDGQWLADLPVRHSSMAFPGSPEQVPVARFALPAVVTAPRHVRARRVEGVARAGILDRFVAVTAELIETLPEGPAEEHRLTSEFLLVADALGADGHRSRGVVHGRDPYGTTAVIAVEGARRLVTDGARPGVLAPSEAYDPADFLGFLTEYGVDWTVEVPAGSR